MIDNYLNLVDDVFFCLEIYIFYGWVNLSLDVTCIIVILRIINEKKILNRFFSFSFIPICDNGAAREGDGGGTASIKKSAEFVMQQYNNINNFFFQFLI